MNIPAANLGYAYVACNSDRYLCLDSQLLGIYQGEFVRVSWKDLAI